MSPEQVRCEQLDARSDIFSFGAVLYEMLSGRQPFACESAAATASAILTRDPPAVTRSSPDAPAELHRILSKCLAKDQQQRYQSARDLVIDLRNLEKAESGNMIVADRGLPQQRRPAWWLLIAAIVLALAGVAVYLLATRSPTINSIAVLPLVNASGRSEC
jgi:serine/threonine protein kinase